VLNVGTLTSFAVPNTVDAAAARVFLRESVAVTSASADTDRTSGSAASSAISCSSSSALSAEMNL
jgi:hypothetical protein